MPMLNTMRWIGFRPRRRAACTAPRRSPPRCRRFRPGPSANSAQKLTACDSDRFDWLRPSGSSIFAADMRWPAPSSMANRPAARGAGSSPRRPEAAPPDHDGGDVGARRRPAAPRSGSQLSSRHPASPSCAGTGPSGTRPAARSAWWRECSTMPQKRVRHLRVVHRPAALDDHRRPHGRATAPGGKDDPMSARRSSRRSRARARRWESPRRAARQDIRCRPSSRGGAARSARAARGRQQPTRCRRRSTACCFTWSYSSGVSGPGLCSSRSGMPSFPMSCSSAARQAPPRSLGVRRRTCRVASAARVPLDAARMRRGRAIPRCHHPCQRVEHQTWPNSRPGVSHSAPGLDGLCAGRRFRPVKRRYTRRQERHEGSRIASRVPAAGMRPARPGRPRGGSLFATENTA